MPEFFRRSEDHEGSQGNAAEAQPDPATSRPVTRSLSKAKDNGHSEPAPPPTPYTLRETHSQPSYLQDYVVGTDALDEHTRTAQQGRTQPPRQKTSRPPCQQRNNDQTQPSLPPVTSPTGATPVSVAAQQPVTQLSPQAQPDAVAQEVVAARAEIAAPHVIETLPPTLKAKVVKVTKARKATDFRIRNPKRFLEESVPIFDAVFLKQYEERRETDHPDDDLFELRPADRRDNNLASDWNKLAAVCQKYSPYTMDSNKRRQAQVNDTDEIEEDESTRRVEAADVCAGSRRSLVRKARYKLYANRYSQAVKILSNKSPPLKLSTNVLTKLIELHPDVRESLPRIPPDGAEPAVIANLSTTNIVAAAKGLRRCSAPGINGVRYEHIKAWAVDDACAKGLLAFVVAILLGKFTPPTVTDCSLTPLSKDGNGVRPIAVGDSLLRFAEVVAVVLVGAPPAHFENIQFGVSRYGTQQVIHRIRHRGKLCIAVDCKNAFNTISRKLIAQAILKHKPWLYPIFHALYASPTNLIVEDVQLLSCTGIRQGDPLSPLFFCLGLQEVLADFCEDVAQPADVAVHAYLDDIYLSVDYEPKVTVRRAGVDSVLVDEVEVEVPDVDALARKLVSVFKSLCVTLQRKAHLVVNETKCQFMCLDPKFRLPSEGEWSRVGKILGAFLGTDALALQKLKDKTKKVVDDLRVIDSFVDFSEKPDCKESLTVQEGLLLLRSCYLPFAKLGFWGGTMDPKLVEEACTEADRVLLEILAKWLGVPLHEWRSHNVMLLSLPCRFGGLGLSLVSRYADYLYYRCVRGCELQEEIGLCGPIASPVSICRNVLRQMFSAESNAGNLCEIYTAEEDPVNINGAFLRAVPRSKALVISNIEMIDALRNRLALHPIHAILAPGQPTGEGELLDLLDIPTNFKVVPSFATYEIRDNDNEPSVPCEYYTAEQRTKLVAEQESSPVFEFKQPGPAECPLCGCKTDNASSVLHVTVCKSLWVSVCKRHDAMVHSLANIAKEKEVIIEVEKRPDYVAACPTDIGDEITATQIERRYRTNFRPDAIFYEERGGSMKCFDVAITTGSTSDIETKKKTKYCTRADNQPQQRVVFAREDMYPIVFDSVGRVGKGAFRFLRKVLDIQPYEKVRLSVLFQKKQAAVISWWRAKYMQKLLGGTYTSVRR